MNRQSLNLILAGLALALGGAVLLSQKKEPAKDPLTTLGPDAIHKISLEHTGKPTIALEKVETATHNQRWMLTAPVHVEADPMNVSTLLSLSNTPVKTRMEKGRVKIENIGLDKPLFTLHLDNATLTFGGTEPLKYLRYVQVDDAGKDSLALIDDLNGPVFDDDYSDLVSHGLLPSDAQLKKIELPGLTLSLSEDGKTWSAAPLPAGVDAAAVQSLVDRWRRAQAMWVQALPADAATAPADQNSNQASNQVRLTTADGVVEFTISARDPQLQLDSHALNLRYVLSKTDVDSLLSLAPPTQAATDGGAEPAATPAASPLAELPLAPPKP